MSLATQVACKNNSLFQKDEERRKHEELVTSERQKANKALAQIEGIQISNFQPPTVEKIIINYKNLRLYDAAAMP